MNTASPLQQLNDLLSCVIVGGPKVAKYINVEEAKKEADKLVNEILNKAKSVH